MGRIGVALESGGQTKSQHLGGFAESKHLVWVGGKVDFNLQSKKRASSLPRGAFSASTDHKEPHSPIVVVEAYVGLTVH